MKMRLKTYKMAMSILSRFLTLKLNILRTIWRIEVDDGSLFCIFHALPFKLNFFFDRRFSLLPLEIVNKKKKFGMGGTGRFSYGKNKKMSHS